MAVGFLRIHIPFLGVLRHVFDSLCPCNTLRCLIYSLNVAILTRIHNTDSNIINTLDYTSCIIPVTTVDRNVDVVNDAFKPVSEQDRNIQEGYDPELYHGAPVAVQLVGRRLQEEKVLALAEYVGGAIDESKDIRSSRL